MHADLGSAPRRTRRCVASLLKSARLSPLARAVATWIRPRFARSANLNFTTDDKERAGIRHHAHRVIRIPGSKPASVPKSTRSASRHPPLAPRWSDFGPQPRLVHGFDGLAARVHTEPSVDRRDLRTPRVSRDVQPFSDLLPAQMGAQEREQPKFGFGESRRAADRH